MKTNSRLPEFLRALVRFLVPIQYRQKLRLAYAQHEMRKAKRARSRFSRAERDEEFLRSYLDCAAYLDGLIDEALVSSVKHDLATADAALMKVEALVPSRPQLPTHYYLYETYYAIDKGDPMDEFDVVTARSRHARGLIDEAKIPPAFSENLAFWDWYDRYVSEQRSISPKKVTPWGHKSFSVSNDDGLIQEIFKRIGTTNRYFVEFGINTGEQTNTTALLFQGWRGLWLEASSCYHVMAKYLFRDFIARGELKTACRFITAENINDVISRNIHVAVGPEIDLLSVDVDGNDFWIWKAITCINPRVLVIEYNSKYHPPAKMAQVYDPIKIFDGTGHYGASLEAMSELSELKGYKLVACSMVGDNAFFVRSDLVGDHFYEPGNTSVHFEPQRAIGFPLGHPAGHGIWDVNPTYAGVALI